MPPQQPQFQQPIPAPAYGGYVPPVPPASTAVGILKQVSSSPLFLVFVSLYSLSLVVQLIWVFANPFAETSSVAFGIMGWILSALTGLGLWMHFGAAADRRTQAMKTSGLTLVKVCAIITLVLVSIVLVLGFVAMAIMLIVVLRSGVAEASVIAAVLLGAYLLIGILAVVYYAKVVTSVSAASICASTGYPRKVSSFVAVVNFVQAFCGIFVIIAQIAAASWLLEIMDFFLDELYDQIGGEYLYLIDQAIQNSLGQTAVWAISSSVLNALVLVLISVAMLSYNSKIDALSYPRAPYPQYPPQNQYPSGF